MSDHRDALQSMFEPTNRFPNFGNLLVSMQIRGIRCHQDTIIEFASPITAFCGLNGTGKSTVLQLAAAAYGIGRRFGFRVDRFIVGNTLDPTVVSSDSRVQFRYWNEDRNYRQLSLVYRGYWDGYDDRPQRPVFFGGIGMYLPKSESPSFVRRAQNLTVSASTSVPERIREWTCRVLGHAYDGINSNSTSIRMRSGNAVASVERAATKYSEANMGFGEARTLHLITKLETLPDKCLVLIEEPETSLHLSAQHEFGRYLVDVCRQKRHQILITTHSEFILQALPSASLVFLDRRGTSIKPIPGLSPLQAKSLMADGHVKALNVLVEDDTAKALLTEIVRRHDHAFLMSIGIHVGGDKDKIANTVRGLEGTGIQIAAVRDADKEGAPRENIFTLPGSKPPEKEIFQSPSFAGYIREIYGVDLSDFASSLRGVDHHDWFPRLAARVQKNESALIWEAAQIYVRGLSEGETGTLVELLKQASQRRTR